MGYSARGGSHESITRLELYDMPRCSRVSALGAEGGKLLLIPRGTEGIIRCITSWEAVNPLGSDQLIVVSFRY